MHNMITFSFLLFLDQMRQDGADVERFMPGFGCEAVSANIWFSGYNKSKL